MAETRIRGQEVVLRLAQGNAVLSAITAITDFTAQYDLATISEGYLGETTMRQDDIFNGVSGSFTHHPESQESFSFVDFLRRRAQRDAAVATIQVNATGRFTFPNGDTPRLLIPDLKFDAVPIATGSRDSYVAMTFSYKASTARFITT